MNKQVAVQDKSVVYEVNGEEVKLSPQIIKQYLVNGNGDVSDQEVVMFLNLCRFQKLNPFLNEAYLVKFGSNPAQRIVSKEAFMKRAESHPQYGGFRAGIVVERNGELVDIDGAIKLSKDVLIGGWAIVKRNDREIDTEVRVDLAEFGKGQATWKQMPMNMIRKTAIVNALREAFPESLGAMYTEDDAQPQSFDIPVEQQLQQEIDEHANKTPIDFDETPVIPETTELPGHKVVNPEDQQGELFTNLSDVTTEPQKRKRDF